MRKMTEQEQFSELEKKLLGIANYQEVSDGIKESKDAGLRDLLYTNLVNEFFGDMDLSQFSDEEKREKYAEIQENVYHSPENAFRLAREGMVTRAKAAEKEYNANKKEIMSKAANKINDVLKNAETKAQAADIMALYLKNIVKTQDVDQNKADSIAKQELAGMMGVNSVFYAHGNSERYKIMALRAIASQYLDEVKLENKNNQKVGYKLNENKISKFISDLAKENGMPEIIPASTLYSNAMRIKLKEE